MRCYVVFGGLVSALALRSVPAAEPGKVDFNFHVRPLLSDRCFACHGPDAKARQAKLRLDVPEGAYKLLIDGTQIIKPRDPSDSEIIRRITSTDPEEIMPPPDSKLTLTKSEIALIRRWVEQGAEYKPHWAFNPVARIEVPAVKSRKSVRNEIDQFVLARLQREKLKPAAEASRETLIRRLSFDLIGLPPTVAEIDAFLADRSSGAYERLVDRLLASPHYGERMANEWMDLARYADTYGYQTDVDRDMSPWRDWVVKAFNENLSYADFILWQLAGDLLPDATREQVLATAFNRLHRQTNEGGSIEEEFRAEYVADRVHTMGTAFLGLTLECARCHDHKYDPISQRDYYRFFAFFNNIDESGLYSHFTQAIPTPALLLYDEGVEAKHKTLKEQLAAAERRRAAVREDARSRFEEWKSSESKLALPEPVAAFSFDQIVSNRFANASGTNDARALDHPELVEGFSGKAVKFSGDNSVVCKNIGKFRRTDPFSFSLRIKPVEKQARAVLFHRSRAWTDSGSRGYELVLEKGQPYFALVHFWPGNMIGVRASQEVTLDRWTQLTVTYDGSSRASGIALYRDGQRLALDVFRDHLFKDIIHRKEWGDADADSLELTLAGRFRDSGFKNGLIDEFQVFDKCLTALEVAALAKATANELFPLSLVRSPSFLSDTSKSEAAQTSQPLPPADRRTSFFSLPEEGSQEEKEALFDYYLARHDFEYRSLTRTMQKLREAESALVNDVREIMVMKELPGRRPTHLLKRGAYDAPGERVEVGTPEAISPFPAEYPRNRLGLAKWMIDRRNPLTARVVVNQVWKVHFGRGLVSTVQDFGSQGQLPTHPELLDWLAGWFMDHGWDRKALHKLIVMSATYRQSSQANPTLTARDPENRLMARGPKHRLSAEQIRDEALATSGLLQAKIGGPSVKPYQPKGVWEESGTGKSYAQDQGDKLYRRSLYTFWRRTAPPPSMLTFDAPSREVCTAKREATTTPLQALVLLNDPQFIEAARVLAERLAREHRADVDARITAGFRALLGREPQRLERRVLAQLYQEQLDYFTAQPSAAEQYLTIGEMPREKSLAAIPLAAMTVVIGTLMNHDEFVMKR